MKQQDTIKNLNQIALKTSPVLGVLFIVHIFKHVPFSYTAFFLAASAAVFFSLSIWFVNIFLVYVSNKDRLHRPGNKTRYLLSYVLSISLITILYVLIPKGFVQAIFLVPEHDLHFPFVISFLLNTVILIIQENMLLRSKKAAIELENAQLRIRHAEALNQQLKQQIHPHFLFNALNILKALIRKDPDIAEDYLVRLSDFLRVSLSSNTENKVKLEDELKLCTDYMEMQRLRFGKALEYTIDIPDPVVQSSGFVPGFSIQLLLENAIKHNWLTKESPLRISITGKERFITVSNNKQPKQSTEISTGLGLPNLSERYRILTGEGVLISSDENEFRVRIKILDL